MFEHLPGAHQAGADGAFGDVENGGDLARVQLLDCGERERLAKFFGESVDEAVHGCLMVRAEKSLFGIFFARGEFEQDVGVVLAVLWVGAEPVDGLPPCGAGEEGALVFHLPPGSGSIEAQEGLLDNVFGVVGVAEHGIGDLKDEARLPAEPAIQRLRLPAEVASPHSS